MEDGEFEGRIGRYHWESEAWWPPEPRPPDGAPNVLVVVLDDVGYAQLGCFGSDIATPHLDGKHSVFGRVTDGMDAVSAVRQGDKINSIEIEES